MAQGKRERARDSRGRPIPGLYVRDGKFSCGFQNGGRWQMVNLRATTITEAKRERESLLAGLREGRVAAKDDATFLAVFEEWQSSRTISARTAEHERYLRDQHLALLKGQKVQSDHRLRHRPSASADARRRTLGLDRERRLQDREGRLRTRAAAGDRHEQPLRRAHERRAPEAEEQARRSSASTARP